MEFIMAKTVFAKGSHPQLSTFNLSHEHKLTCNMGQLIPCLLTEVIPGDTFTCNSDLFLRLMPLASPMMHRVDVYMHFFFVLTRLVWSEFDKFLTGGAAGTAEPAYPYMVASGLSHNIGTLGDYLGLPRHITATEHVSALPFRAYNLIYNEWYRDENLIEPLVVNTTSGNDTGVTYYVQNRAWKKGYFESALPWTQRGTSSQVPLNGDVPVCTVHGLANTLNFAASWNAAGEEDVDQIPDGITHGVLMHGATAAGVQDTTFSTTKGSIKSAAAAYGEHTKTGYQESTFSKVQNFTGLIAALSQSGLGIDIRDIRLASAVQRYLERNARGGVRYIEWLLSHFGVRSSDARLQRPEYLGGGKSPIVIGEVLQNSESGNTPQGWMAGQAVSAQKSLGWTRSFEEFGYVMGILSIMPKASYEQGIPKMWTRFGRYDQVLPAFAGVGDQAVYMRELYANAEDPSKVFGYVPRFEEMRRIPSQVHGEFRVDGGTLGYWHMGRYFESEPQLSKEFVECNPTDRVFAVEDTTAQKCLLDIHHNIRAIRPLPKNGVPGIRCL